jgi:hypothetical protein
MPVGRYTVMDGDGNRVGTEEFRCASGPMGWRYFSDIEMSVPEPHREIVDLAVDASWRPVRAQIDTGSHEILLLVEGDRLAGFRDGRPVELPWGSETQLDYLSPAFNAVMATWLSGTGEVEVVFLEGFTCEPRMEQQRYELLVEEEVTTPAGRFAARRWRHTRLSTGWTGDMWVAGEVVVAYDALYALEWYEPGATGPPVLA